MIKKCNMCKEEKEINKDNFYYNSKGKPSSKCKICSIEYSKKWKKENKPKVSEYRKTYKEKNKEKVLLWKKQYRNRRSKDVCWKLRRNVSNTIRHYIKLQKQVKNNKTWQCLPYTPEMLRDHLEKQFDEHMSWENYGSYWHIDHIYPQSKLPFKNLSEDNFLKCWSLENLQPLEASENIFKSNKII